MRKAPWGLLTLGLLLLLASAPVAAQESDLIPADVTVVTEADDFGQMIRVARGKLVNAGDEAFTDVSLRAEVYNAEGELVGEGLGFLVNACRAGLLPDFALQPNEAQPFEVRLEMFNPDAVATRYVLVPQAATTPASPPQAEPVPGITRISDEEVVEVEWLDSRALRYATGCTRDLFLELAWTHYSLRTNTALPVIHPRAGDVNDVLLQALNLTDPVLLENSALTFAPTSNRLVYQSEANRFITAEADGSFVRNLYNTLYNRTLQGIYWLPEDRFLAYYYGAYGDPVVYFTATAQGQPISVNPEMTLPSAIVPGVSPDARRAVIAGTFGDQTGYFLKALINNSEPQLLFAAEPPGNHYPPPLFTVTPGEANGDAAREIIYLARPVDGEARLQCFDLMSGGPVDLAPLPIDLATEDRARWWLSPDGQLIALAANGVNGGLWLIDLAQLPTCGV